MPTKIIPHHILAERIIRGAAYLDAHVVGWRDLINPEILNLAEGDHCILGQALGDFWGACKRLNLSTIHARNLGFYLTGQEDDAGSDNSNWSALTELWICLLEDAPLPLCPSQLRTLAKELAHADRP